MQWLNKVESELHQSSQNVARILSESKLTPHKEIFDYYYLNATRCGAKGWVMGIVQAIHFRLCSGRFFNA
jgi:hypothetical protein